MNKKLKQTIVTAFRPHSEGLAKLFGTLEADIIELIWARREASARDVFEALRDLGQRLSYGAVKTVLDRLVQKQVLVRVMENNQYLYTARLTREEFTRSAVGEILSSLLASFGEPVYTQFLEQVQAADPAMLAQLAQRIQEAEAQQGDAAGERSENPQNS